MGRFTVTALPRPTSVPIGNREESTNEKKSNSELCTHECFGDSEAGNYKEAEADTGYDAREREKRCKDNKVPS